MGTKEHYEAHLASYYSWVFGGADANYERTRSFFRENNICPADGGRALDLGAGSGFQSIPLSELGYRVTTVDFSRRLLDELIESRGPEQVETVEADLLDFQAYAGREPELIVCMGDTLSHLPDMNSVERLITNCFHELRSGGRLFSRGCCITYNQDQT